MRSPVKIGTRGSALAFYQAELVRSRLNNLFPLIEFELVKIHTKGDMIRRGALSTIGRGVFTREIEEALSKGVIDLAVHSAKDLTTELPAGLLIGAYLEREDPRDCLVARDHLTLGQLPRGARVGTSSPRRKVQLLRLREDLVVCEMRGNVDTRIKKIEEGELDATALAYAGLKRLGCENTVTEIFDEKKFLPQPGQGAIAVEIRAGDPEVNALMESLNHGPTWTRMEAERAFLGRLQGGCQIPTGITSEIAGRELHLTGALFSLDGAQVIWEQISGPTEQCVRTGQALADRILAAGGEKILEEIRHAAKE